MKENINSVAGQSAKSKKSFCHFQIGLRKLFNRKPVLAIVVISVVFVVNNGFINPAQSANVRSNPVEGALKQQNEKDVRADFGKLPMTFEINQGQTDDAVRFMAHGSNYNLYLTNNNAVLSLYPSPKQRGAQKIKEK